MYVCDHYLVIQETKLSLWCTFDVENKLVSYMARDDKVKYYDSQLPFVPWGVWFLHMIKEVPRRAASYRYLFSCGKYQKNGKENTSGVAALVAFSRQAPYSFTAQEYCEFINGTGGLQYNQDMDVKVETKTKKKMTYKENISQTFSSEIAVIIKGSFVLLHAVTKPVAIKKMKILMEQTAPSVGPQPASYGPSRVTLFPSM
eukprot:GHVS01002611.1.p1 GENE.GHVS01002611.1~~GHVS01002611.1.p1  ORF type:complete len:201 (+),score=10.49 GHVS01002611.1:273-875(+)